MRKELGEYVVADSEICHGKLTFKGTRIFVKDVLEQVAEGLSFDEIVSEWRGAVSKEAIREAVMLAAVELEERHGPQSVPPREEE